MSAILSFVLGPIGKIAGVAVLALSLIGTAAALVHEHDAHVRAVQSAAEQAARMATMQADHARAIAALQADAAAASAAAAKLTTVRSAINAAPHTNACNSAAVHAAVDSLRHVAAVSH